MEGQVMALRQGSECFTKWTHVESGRVIIHRLHQIEVQDRDGRMHFISGEKLPDFIFTSSGHGYVGVDLSTLLLSPKSLSRGRRKCKTLGLPVIVNWRSSQDARRRLSASRQEDECFTQLIHWEDERILHRQLSRIEIHAEKRLYIFTGNALPEFMGICTGRGYKGEHSLQIHISRKPPSVSTGENLSWPPAPAAWPELRDVMHVALGVIGFLIVRFLLELIKNVA